jgi:hypothetical protein
MVFSIEVKIRGKNDEFSFKDVEITHDDYYDGKTV